MMNIELHTVLTLDDNEKYIVVAKAEYDGNAYDYLLQLSADGEDVTEQVAVVKEEKEDNRLYIVEVNDKNELDKLAPLFCKQLEDLH